MDFKEVLNQWMNQSNHYLCGHLIEDYEQIITSQGVVYQLRVENICLNEGYETIDVLLDDILIWLYLRGEK